MKDYILELDKPRALRFGFRAIRTIRQKFGEGRSLDSLLNIKVDEVPILVWAGLKWEDKALTIEQVEDLLDSAISKTYTIMQVTEIVLEALATQMGVEPKKVKADTPKATVETEGKKQPKETIPSSKKQKK